MTKHISRLLKKLIVKTTRIPVTLTRKNSKGILNSNSSYSNQKFFECSGMF